MYLKDLKNELQNILSGKSVSSYDVVIQAVAGELRTSQRTSPMAEAKHQNKKEETKKLIEFATTHNLLIDAIYYTFLGKLLYKICTMKMF